MTKPHKMFPFLTSRVDSDLVDVVDDLVCVAVVACHSSDKPLLAESTCSAARGFSMTFVCASRTFPGFSPSFSPTCVCHHGHLQPRALHLLPPPRGLHPGRLGRVTVPRFLCAGRSLGSWEEHAQHQCQRFWAPLAGLVLPAMPLHQKMSLSVARHTKNHTHPSSCKMRKKEKVYYCLGFK